uniref:Uncharacterized protein n=1 Tax=Sphaerodactylus townsendi TaxID=933632 RepID=A0ACB8G4R9_9SAUR
MVKGSYEKHHECGLGSDFGLSPACQSSFHYVKYKQPTLDVKLPKEDLDYTFGPCTYNREDGSLQTQINLLPTEKKIMLAENNEFSVHVKTEDCQNVLDVRLGYDLCPQEQDFLGKRKKIVATALKKVLGLERDLQDHEPHRMLKGGVVWGHTPNAKQACPSPAQVTPNKKNLTDRLNDAQEATRIQPISQGRPAVCQE